MDEATDSEYFKCFRVLLHFMKIFGIFPFIFSHQGTSRRLFFSRVVTFSSIAIYLVMLSNQVFYFGENIKLMTRNFDYNLLLRILPTITVRCQQLVIPLITWNKSKQMHVHWENWKKFQNNLERFKGVRYSSPVRNKVRWIPITLASILIVFTLAMKSYYDRTVLIPPTYLTLVHTTSISAIVLYWYANCLYVKSLSREILNLIAKAIENKENRSIRDLTSVWLNLSELNEEFGAAHSVLFLCCFSCAAINIVGLFYSFLNLLIFEPNGTSGISYLSNAIICAIVVASFCESADSLFQTMVTQIKEAILVQNMVTMKEKPLRSVVIFLNLIDAKKSKITFNGFMVVNRAAMITCFAGVVNYLIVLRQFDKIK